MTAQKMNSRLEKNLVLERRPSLYAPYVLVVLTVVSAFNFFDRYLLIITMESIKKDLHLTDSELGLITGFAFAAVYTLAGIFVAHWADHGNRVKIIALGLVVWSAMTALGAAAASFVQLALCRFGVGFGESACSPPAYSVITDYFRPEKRATAIAIYGLGLYVGMGLGFVVGGWINEHYGWRMAFLAGGLPGLLVAVLIRLTLKEPLRGNTDYGAADTRLYPAKAVLGYVAKHPSYISYVLGTGLFVFTGNAADYWGATFLMRVHAIGSEEVGSRLGFLGCMAGISGTMIFAFIADRLARDDPRWYLWIATIGGGLTIPFTLLFLFDGGSKVYFYYFLVTFFGGGYVAPIIALTQRLLPLRMRAISSAIILMSFNIVGIAFGNLMIGVVSDWLEPSVGVNALRYAMALTTIGGGVGIVLMCYSALRLPKDMARDSLR